MATRRKSSKTPKRTPRRRTPTIFIVSDGRGDTCSQVVRAAAVQFDERPYRTVLEAGVSTVDRVRAIVERAALQHAVIFFTLVGDETREAMKAATTKALVPTVDVLGPAFSAMHDLFKAAPRAKPGLLYASDRERFDVHAAIDYTLKHDDGQRPHELKHADVVLVGVSRASKSSTCFYLACEGIRAANVPLVPGVPPPPQLLALDPGKVVGLRVNVLRLMTVREIRASALRLRDSDPYLDRRTVAREVNAAHRLMERQGWQSFDASYMAIEEIAREIRHLCGLERRGFR